MLPGPHAKEARDGRIESASLESVIILLLKDLSLSGCLLLVVSVRPIDPKWLVVEVYCRLIEEGQMSSSDFKSWEEFGCVDHKMFLGSLCLYCLWKTKARNALLRLKLAPR